MADINPSLSRMEPGLVAVSGCFCRSDIIDVTAFVGSPRARYSCARFLHQARCSSLVVLSLSYSAACRCSGSVRNLGIEIYDDGLVLEMFRNAVGRQHGG